MKKVVLVLVCFTILFTSCKKEDIDKGPFKISGRVYCPRTGKVFSNIKFDMISTTSGNSFGKMSTANSIGTASTDSNGNFEFTYGTIDNECGITTMINDQYFTFMADQNIHQDLVLQ